MTTYLIYDGSFDGFLTSIFERYERKLADFVITRPNRYQPQLTSTHLEIKTDKTKSQRVWTGLTNSLSAIKRNEFYKTFLSELPEMERVLCDFVRHVFSSKHNVEEDLGHPSVIGVSKIAHQVHREKHRMEAFIRFQRTIDNLYFASINPDFNVLPLIVSHFKDRYADQNWLIYDKHRKYGIHYDCSNFNVTEVQVQLDGDASGEFLPENICHGDEIAYQKLWKNYFYSVNIGSRKNKKLHVRHVPTRYWRYLTEKKTFE
jgi:probable DNA metabolism protein